MIKPLPPTALPAPMTPGTYLRKRREAAGVSLELAAVAFIPWPPAGLPAVRGALGTPLVALVLKIAAWLAELENDQRHVDSLALTQLQGVVPFEREAYDRLVALHHGVDVPPPSICRECGCGVLTACSDQGHACAWSETDPHLCTACERREAIDAAADFPETEDAS